MTVRAVSPDELCAVVDVGYMFFKEGNLPGGFKRDVFLRNWSAILKERRGIFLGAFEDEKFTGGLGAVLCPDLNNGQLLAVECFWYVLPEYRGHGLRLLRAFERWAKEAGVRRVAMIHLMSLHPEAMRQLYERLGYRAVEINYIKEL